jgi:hypothetical protein
MNRRDFLKKIGVCAPGAILLPYAIETTVDRCGWFGKKKKQYICATALSFYQGDDETLVLRELHRLYLRNMRQELMKDMVPYEPVEVFYQRASGSLSLSHSNHFAGSIGFKVRMGPLNKKAPDIDIHETWSDAVKFMIDRNPYRWDHGSENYAAGKDETARKAGLDHWPTSQEWQEWDEAGRKRFLRKHDSLPLGEYNP